MPNPASILIRNDYLNEYSPFIGALEYLHQGAPWPTELRVNKFWNRYESSNPLGLARIETTKEDDIKIKELDDLADTTNSVLSAIPVDYKRLIDLMLQATQLCGYGGPTKLKMLADYFK